ncbi:uncharacterized protein IL334_006549 [Kwoniella shivajii]|uniref:ER membrane protein complex subunit 6 n=1 Tax=Kwoniella shivajii TaxID=564305 RepID=A0ABZ1D9B2_9TREE|nr:hypothetical protein IL334_006549 [Kwoniella shivajii]
MNPTAPPPTAAHLSPDASPLHPPSVMHNTRVLSSLGTYSACFSGLIAGLLGLTNLSGFSLYIISSIFTASILFLIKCDSNVIRYVPQANLSVASESVGMKALKGYWALTGIGQENLLGFLLFWIGSYALIHVYD